VKVLVIEDSEAVKARLTKDGTEEQEPVAEKQDWRRRSTTMKEKLDVLLQSSEGILV